MQDPVTETKTVEQRKAILAQAVQQAVLRGGRIESQTDTMAVMVRGKPVNHILHLILTLVTVGLWGIVWLILVLTGGEKREMITVDDYGNVLIQKP